MGSFTAFAYKEILDGVRSYRFLILFLGAFFFAVFDPVILKLTPIIMRSQTDVDISGLFELSRTASVENFFADLFEITTFITALSLMGIVAGEKKTKSLIIPYCSGANFSGVIIAKLAVHISFMFVVLAVSVPANYFYSGIIFGRDSFSFTLAMKAVLLFGFYFAFLISLITFLSSLFSKGIIAVFIVLPIVYILPFISGLLNISRFVPTFLVTRSFDYEVFSKADFPLTIICTVVYTVLLGAGTIQNLKRRELAR